MKILLIGSGGREHALAWHLKKNPAVQLISAPGSSALASLGEVRPIASDNITDLTALAQEIKPDLTIIGPEAPLVLGLTDNLKKLGFKVFGPTAAAAQIEGSKVFAKDFMIRHNLPTASYAVFYDAEEAKQYLNASAFPVVLKADGLAQGKGVVISGNLTTAYKAVDELTSMSAGSRLIIEEYLAGEEVSYLCLTDGHTILPFPAIQDHKTIFESDRGPNTGGMGAYCPAPMVTPLLTEIIYRDILRPAVDGLAAEDYPFTGVLYAGLIITMAGPKLLEFNARFGDPETQALIPRLKGDLSEICLATAEGRLDQINLDWDPRSSVCVVMSAEGYPGPYRQGDVISGLDKAAARPDTYIFEAGVERKDGQFLTKGGRVLGVTALGRDLEEAIKLAYEAVEDISWPGAHYRKDIGLQALIRSQSGNSIF